MPAEMGLRSATSVVELAPSSRVANATAEGGDSTMPLTKQDKEKMVQDLSDRIGRAKAALVADYAKLNVASVTEIRRQFRSAGVDYKVVKNTLVKRVLKGTAREALGKVFTRTTAVAFKYDEEYGKLGRIAKELTTKYPALKFKAGFV